MDQRLLRLWRGEQRVASGDHLSEAFADHQQHVGSADALGELRVDADAHVAGIVRMPVVEHVLIAERTGNRQRARFGKAREIRAGLRVPAAAAGDDHRPLR